jgi:hypothetical protein
LGGTEWAYVVKEAQAKFKGHSAEEVEEEETNVAFHFFFLVSEGLRSRCYGRTAALRLIVQPCDED